MRTVGFGVTFQVILLLSILFFVPVCFGGNNPVAWSVAAVLTAILMCWMGGVSFVSRTNLPVAFSRYRLPLFLYGGVCMWVYLQSVGGAPEFAVHPLWQEASQVLGVTLAKGAVSLNPHDTQTGLIRLLTYAGVFWCAMQTGRNAKHGRFLLWGIAVIVLLNAGYALGGWAAGSTHILWLEKWVGREEVTGTFVNRNHFAVYAGIGILIFQVLLLEHFRSIWERGGVKSNVFRLIEQLAAYKTLLLVLGSILLAGVVLLTRSRAGIVCVGIASVACIVLFALASHKAKHDGVGGVARVLLPASILVFLVVLTGVTGGERLLERLNMEAVVDYERLGVYARTIDAIGDAFLPGIGYSAFADAFPMYRDAELSAYGRWLQAHNSFLENVMELGAPGAMMLFLSAGFCVLACIRGLFTRRKDKGVLLVAVSVSVMLFMHSLIDFPLQISGITVTYAALLGLGYAQSWSSMKL